MAGQTVQEAVTAGGATFEVTQPDDGIAARLRRLADDWERIEGAMARHPNLHLDLLAQTLPTGRLHYRVRLFCDGNPWTSEGASLLGRESGGDIGAALWRTAELVETWEAGDLDVAEYAAEREDQLDQEVNDAS